MPVENSCLIGTLGLLEHEISLMQSIFKVSNNRDHVRYELLQTNLDKAHIILAAIDNEAAMETWQQLANSPRSPVLLAITPKELGKFPGFAFSRPFSPTKVLAVLDEIVKAKLSGLFDEKIFHREEKTRPRETPEPHKIAHGKYRALVVDDSKTVLNHLTHELTFYNFDADVAETGEQGLEMIEAKDYDIILLDVVLPGIDGYQVCKSIKRNQNKKHIPVVMLTSKSSPFDKVRGSMSGCSAYLTKPVDIEKFHQVLDDIITKHD
jgi:two-component system, cell cycle response regulator